MNKKLLLLTILGTILSTTAINAQLIGTNPTFTASIYGGATFVEFSSDNQSNDVVDYKSKFGYGVHFGYSEMIDPDTKLNLQVGLMKAAWYAEDPFMGGEYEFEALYLTMQPSLQRYFGNTFIKGGGFLDYGLAGTNTLPSGSEFKIFEDEALNRTNAGLVIGAGLDVSDATRGFIGNIWDIDENYFFEIFADYRLGLADVEGASDSDNQKATLSFLSIGIRSNF